MALAQPASLYEEACSYIGTDWLSSSVSQRVVRGQFLHAFCGVLVIGLGLPWPAHSITWSNQGTVCFEFGVEVPASAKQGHCLRGLFEFLGALKHLDTWIHLLHEQLCEKQNHIQTEKNGTFLIL